MSENQIFRQKSLDKIASPEQLNDYITVTTPGVWMLMVAVILILVGALVWGSMAELSTTLKAPGIVNDNEASIYVRAEDIFKIKRDKPVRINGTEGVITYIGNDDHYAEEVLGDYTLNEVGYDEDTIVYVVTADVETNNGLYLCDIVLDNVSPVSFLINNED